MSQNVVFCRYIYVKNKENRGIFIFNYKFVVCHLQDLMYSFFSQIVQHKISLHVTGVCVWTTDLNATAAMTVWTGPTKSDAKVSNSFDFNFRLNILSNI